MKSGDASLLVVDHPIVRDRISRLRSSATESETFRQLIRQLTHLILPAALTEIRTAETTIRTPLEVTTGERIDQEIVFVGVLRAALTMVDAALDLVPEAAVGFLGIQRDPMTHRPSMYYGNMPPCNDRHKVVVLDPMLATGGSAVDALDAVVLSGATDITFCGVIGCPEGVAAVRERHPSVPIVLAALDRELDSNSYILPGLGDAGDRSFRT